MSLPSWQQLLERSLAADCHFLKLNLMTMEDCYFRGFKASIVSSNQELLFSGPLEWMTWCKRNLKPVVLQSFQEQYILRGEIHSEQPNIIQSFAYWLEWYSRLYPVWPRDWAHLKITQWTSGVEERYECRSSLICSNILISAAHWFICSFRDFK